MRERKSFLDFSSLSLSLSHLWFDEKLKKKKKLTSFSFPSLSLLSLHGQNNNNNNNNNTGILLWPLGGLAFVGHSSSPRKDLWVAVAGPLTHLPQLAFWMAVEVGSFAAAGFGPRVIWRVWPPSNNVWLALVTFAVRFV